MYEHEIAATKSLIAFCIARGYNVRSVDVLKSCLSSLQCNDPQLAVQAYESIPLGGMGCFNDWLPAVKSKKEKPEKVYDEFEKLLSKWSESMRNLKDSILKKASH